MTHNQHILASKFGTDAIIGCHHKEPQPLVSVIIPTYNCLEYLPRALKSVQQQSFKHLEIIVIDDGSSDNTWAYLALASLCDQRIRAIKGDGGSVAAARNKGINAALGQLIAFLDADDYWLKNKLDHQINFHLSHPQATMSFTNYRHINEQQQDLGDCFGYWPHFAKFINKLNHAKAHYHLLNKTGLGRIFAENVIGTSTVMINRHNIKASLLFDTQLASAEDWDLWLRCAKQGPIGFSAKIEMIYLMRKNSESSKTQVRLKYISIIMKRHYKAVLSQNPLAILHSLSRLLTAHAECQRPTDQQQFWLKRKVQSLKACLLHSLAFILSPSYRVFRAILADIKHMLF